MRSAYLRIGVIGSLGMLVALPASAQSSERWALCPAPLLTPLEGDPTRREHPDTPVTIQGERSSVSGEPPIYEFRGNVSLERADQTFQSDYMRYDSGAEQIIARGNAQLRESGALIRGDSGEYWLDESRGFFQGVSEYRLSAGHMQGSAARLVREDADRTRYTDATLSTCLPEAEFWKLSATTTTLNNDTRQGRAYNATLSILDLPVFYTPYLQFPIGDERLTGFLTPTIGHSDENGTTVSLPWYWNIAPNYDATITPTSYWKRGLLMDTEVRYLQDWLQGDVSGSYLPSDDVYGEDRWAIDQHHQLSIGSALRGEFNQQRTSDPYFSDDFGDDFSYRSASFLESNARLNWTESGLSASIDAQEWQQVNQAVSFRNQPYARKPRVQLGYAPFQGIGPFNYRLNAEATEFTHPDADRVQGRRIDLAPQLSLPYRTLGYYIEPAVTWRHTDYDLSGDLDDGNASPSRTMPIYSVDAGIFLERPSTLFDGVYQTLEPRIFYRRAPDRQQSDLPNFDSSDSTVTFASMFREEAFSGLDRIEDGERISTGLTTRFLDQASGREYLRASVGQIFYLEDRVVAANGAGDRNRSETITELRIGLPAGLSAEVDYRFDSEESGNSTLRTLLRWQDRSDRVINVGLRRREVDNERTLDQAELSFAWPLTQGIAIYGGVLDDLKDNEIRERFYGVQQAGCCHAWRLVSRETLQRDPSRDEASLEREIMLELELKGLGGIGDRIQSFLGSEIDGFNPER